MKVTIKGLNKVTAKGRTYYYHRKTRTRLHGELGSSEFMLQLESLESAVSERRAAAGSLGHLIVQYRQSPEYAQLAPRTKHDYEKVFSYLKPIDSMPVASITTKFIIGLRDKTFEKRKRRFANYVVQVVRLLLNWARPRGLVKGNPAETVPHIRRPKTMAVANRAWLVEELTVVLRAAPPHLRAAIALGVYAGLREGDVIRFPWSGYDGTAVSAVQGKTGEAVWVPAHPELREILEVTEKKGPLVVVNSKGAAYTESGFRASFFKLIGRLEKRGAVQPGLTFHGLRHTVATMLADAGADTRDIAAVLGQKSEAMAAHYAGEADRKRRAKGAFKKLERNQKRTKSAKPD